MLRIRSSRIKIPGQSDYLSTVMTFIQAYWNRTV